MFYFLCFFFIEIFRIQFKFPPPPLSLGPHFLGPDISRIESHESVLAAVDTREISYDAVPCGSHTHDVIYEHSAVKYWSPGLIILIYKNVALQIEIQHNGRSEYIDVTLVRVFRRQHGDPVFI